MRVSLFVTCFNDTLFPATGQAVVTLLDRLAHGVAFPAEQTCCGQMHVNTGYVADAVPIVRTFVNAFEGYDAVVAPSGSCVASVRHQHRLVARRSGDASLVREVEVECLPLEKTEDIAPSPHGGGVKTGVFQQPLQRDEDFLIRVSYQNLSSSHFHLSGGRFLRPRPSPWACACW